jgi:hypothetical protein
VDGPQERDYAECVAKCPKCPASVTLQRAGILGRRHQEKCEITIRGICFHFRCLWKFDIGQRLQTREWGTVLNLSGIDCSPPHAHSRVQSRNFRISLWAFPTSTLQLNNVETTIK